MKKILLLLSIMCASLFLPAARAQETVTVDLSVNNGAATYRGSGFLGGFGSSTYGPATNQYVMPLKPKLLRGDYFPWVQDTNGYATANGLGTKAMWILGDSWIQNYGGFNPSGTRAVTSGTQAAWVSMVQMIVNTAISNGQTYQWDIWNEPDISTFWTGSASDFYNFAWKPAWAAIKGISTGQQTVGPSIAGFGFSMSSFLSSIGTDYPDVLDWHEASFPPSQIPTDYANYSAQGAAVGVTKFSITEYATSTNTYYPGSNVQYIAQIERAGLYESSHSCWNNDCAQGGYLPDLSGAMGASMSNVTQQNALWYAYQAYANVTGNIAGVTAGATTDGVAGLNSLTYNSNSIFGRAGSGSTNVTFTFNNIPSYLIVSGQTNAVVRYLANDNGGGSTGSTIYSSGNVSVSGSSVSLTVTSVGANDAVFISLNPPAGGGSNNVYIAPTSMGSNNGQDCADAFIYTYFNTGANWSASPSGTLIGPGTTVHTCGTIPGTLTFQGSGTSGSPVTLLAESGSALSQPYGTLINLNGQSNTVLNGGTNGIIENTQNGTLLTYQQNVQAVQASGATNVTMENWTCENIYVAVPPTTAAGFDQTLNNCIYANGIGGTINISGNVMHDVGWAILLGGLTNSSTVNVFNNNIYNMDHGVVAGDGSNSYTVNTHDNQFGATANWDTTSDAYHHDPIHIYNGASGPGTWGTDIYNVYNNVFSGNPGANNTANVFIENASGTEPQINYYNNVHIQYPGSYLNDGMFQSTNGGLLGSLKMLNNTFLCDPTVSNMSSVRTGATSITLKNNVFSGCNNFLSIEAGSAGGSGIDYNIYADQGAGGNNRWNWESAGGTNTFATWQADCGTGCDAHSSYNASAGLSGTGTVNSGSVVIGAGVNLTSLGITALNSTTSAGNTVTPSARPASAAWDVGAYEFGSSPPPPVVPPVTPPGAIMLLGSLPNGTVGQTYSATLTASGGTPPFNWKGSSFPAGLSFSAAGVLTGLPTTAGTFSPTATVTDSGKPIQQASQSFSVTISAAVLTPETLVSSAANLSFAAQAPSVAQAQTFTLADTTPAGIHTPFTVTTDQSWLTVSDSSPSTASTLTVTANAKTLAAGTYTGNVIFTAANYLTYTFTNSPLKIPVTFTVSAAPGKTVTSVSIAGTPPLATVGFSDGTTATTTNVTLPIIAPVKTWVCTLTTQTSDAAPTVICQ